MPNEGYIQNFKRIHPDKSIDIFKILIYSITLLQ